jgi:hypothetical protein
MHSATHIIRGEVRTYSYGLMHSPEYVSALLHTLCRIVASSREDNASRTKAAFILCEPTVSQQLKD